MKSSWQLVWYILLLVVLFINPFFFQVKGDATFSYFVVEDAAPFLFIKSSLSSDESSRSTFFGVEGDAPFSCFVIEDAALFPLVIRLILYFQSAFLFCYLSPFLLHFLFSFTLKKKTFYGDLYIFLVRRIV